MCIILLSAHFLFSLFLQLSLKSKSLYVNDYLLRLRLLQHFRFFCELNDNDIRVRVHFVPLYYHFWRNSYYFYNSNNNLVTPHFYLLQEYVIADFGGFFLPWFFIQWEGKEGDTWILYITGVSIFCCCDAFFYKLWYHTHTHSHLNVLYVYIFKRWSLSSTPHHSFCANCMILLSPYTESFPSC